MDMKKEYVSSFAEGFVQEKKEQQSAEKLFKGRRLGVQGVHSSLKGQGH